MAVLSSTQRKTLETAVKEARNSAQKGADNALKSLAADQAEPFAHFSPELRTLRNRLRQKGRLLGDNLAQSGEQAIHKLSYELAYETWHKMLFAKFLEVNDLLMHPDGVAVTLMDCEELAAEEGFINKWETAMHYASLMLPAIFRPTDPIMQVHFSSNDRIELEEIISGLEDSIFKSDDALGWVYQFWQSEEKYRINKSGNKIDGESLPAVTQLFTEQYMVDFLIDNTLGAWWVSRNPGVETPVKFEYLRTLEDGTAAAGIFEGWPDRTAEVTSLDPCMGSGHFVTSLFPVFAKLRMWEEGLSKEEATDKVINENLHGLEIDPRCTQIAAFNLALTAWKFCGYYRELPEMNLACSGIAPKGKEEDWVKLVGKVDRDDQVRMENGMRQLFRHFQLAPELGSLLDPTTIKADAFTASFDLIQPVLEKALDSELEGEQLERGVMAAGIAKAGQLLSKKYTLQITNVPYLGKGKFDRVLSDYVLKNYPDAKSDLATVFLDRLFKTSKPYGIVTTVIPQNWLFLTTYKKFREKLLKNQIWNIVARLGSGAFSQISGEVVKAILISLSNSKPQVEQSLIGFDVSEATNAAAKDSALKKAEVKVVLQREQLVNPDARVIFDSDHQLKLLSDFTESSSGQSSFDRPRFYFSFQELAKIERKVWKYTQGTSYKKYRIFDGLEEVLRWENGEGDLFKQMEALKETGYTSGIWRAGEQIWGKIGVLVSLTGELIASIYLGEAFDQNCSVITVDEEENLFAIASFVFSEKYNKDIRQIDQALKVTSATTIKCGVDLDFWKNNLNPIFENGWPKPYSGDPTQWLFHGHPQISDNPLQVAIGRILGYRWPAELDKEMELDPEAHFHIQDIQAFDHLSDEDGIFCIPSVNGEAAGADRLRDYIQAVWGEAYAIDTLNQLLEKEDATSKNLENWLRDEFFAQHCKVFNNRPFIWQIWDGRKDGFSVLVNYHKLTKNNLSKLIYTYLGDWIRMCESKKRSGESGADGMLSAALKLKESLELILEGEKPFDIFVRWKSPSEQSIGWDPDLNDGVRLNIRPFVEAGILRKKFNVKWGTDRGKNPPGSHWGEERNNDVHLSLEEKRRAKNL
jgi:hypothetical protein